MLLVEPTTTLVPDETHCDVRVPNLVGVSQCVSPPDASIRVPAKTIRSIRKHIVHITDNTAV
jgi:hypothetical protein